MPTNAEIIAGTTTQCCIPEGLVQRARLWLAAQQLDPVPTVAEIMAGITTQCCIPEGLVNRALLWVESEIEGGGGGGTNFITDGAIDPVAAPSDPAQNWIYVNATAAPKTVWFWEGGGAAWAQIV